MIVARGIGRVALGASGIIVAAGFGLVSSSAIEQLPIGSVRPKISQRVDLRDAMELLQLTPIIVEVINAERR